MLRCTRNLFGTGTQPTTTRRRTLLTVESLEYRCLMNAGTINPAVINPPAFNPHQYFLQGPDDHATAMALQDDGKIVVVGDRGAADKTEDFLVARFNIDGTPDSGFGSGGVATISFEPIHGEIPAGYGGATGVAIASDGTIVVVGSAEFRKVQKSVYGNDYTYDFDFAIARLDGTAKLDNTFGTGGLVSVAFDQAPPSSGGQNADLAAAVAVGTVNGKENIVVVGTAQIMDDHTHPASVTLDENGKVLNQIAQPVFTAAEEEAATGVALDSAGNPVTVGWVTATAHPITYDVYIKGKNFFKMVFLGNTLSTPYDSDVKVAADGKFVVTGNGPNGVGMVARFDADGKLDTQFGTNGQVTLPFTGRPHLTLEPDGKIVVAGQNEVVRLSATGLVDQTFNLPSGGAFTQVAGVGVLDIAFHFTIVVAGVVPWSSTTAWTTFGVAELDGGAYANTYLIPLHPLTPGTAQAASGLAFASLAGNSAWPQATPVPTSADTPTPAETAMLQSLAVSSGPVASGTPFSWTGITDVEALDQAMAALTGAPWDLA